MEWCVVVPKDFDAFSYPYELEEHIDCRYGYCNDDRTRCYCAAAVVRRHDTTQISNGRIVGCFSDFSEAMRYLEKLWGG